MLILRSIEWSYDPRHSYLVVSLQSVTDDVK